LRDDKAQSARTCGAMESSAEDEERKSKEKEARKIDMREKKKE